MITLTTGNRFCGAGIHDKCRQDPDGPLACSCCCHTDDGLGFDFEHRSTTIRIQQDDWVKGVFHVSSVAKDYVVHLAATEGERCAAFGGEYIGSCGAERVFAEIGTPDVAGPPRDDWSFIPTMQDFRFCPECLRHMFRAAAMGWNVMTGEALPPPSVLINC